ncbi:MAG: peptidoglycan DD-metalloendopeptidase family protein [Deltaproteobacteria bacterium]|nr:peptidoglycan DD-metalloendopeptidase family protein [Deltaproteobacteria bacterium]
MAKKAYTVLIASQKAAQVKKFIFSPLTLKISAVVLGIGILVSSYIIYDYVTYKKQLAEIQALRAETDSQQKEIHLFLQKINLLEEQLNKLKEMEKQMERDLKEITELKKGKKAYPVAPRKKTPSGTKEVGKEMSLFKEDEVSVLEKERARLVSHLHQDLLELRKEAFHREQSLQELKDFLQAQKSILLSVPSLWPVVGRITSGFGDSRESPFSGGTKPHLGLDISVPLGTPVLAPADGVVSLPGRESEYGRLVCIDHGNGFSTVYGHLKEILVQVGDKVRTGQTIGTVGISGNSTGPHLHYEVRINGNRVNPLHYLN